jgi:hypothetical protein
MRIQILPLPAVVVGDVVDEPFAIVVDQFNNERLNIGGEMAGWDAFREACGARALHITEDTVEIVDRYAEPDTSEIDRLAAYLLEHFDSEIGEGSAVDLAIRLLGQLLMRRDAAKIKAELNFMLKSRQERPEPPRASDLEQRLQDAGEHARQALGIDGTMGDAQDVPHAYDDDEGNAPYCIVCGLGRLARVHKRAADEQEQG